GAAVKPNRAPGVDDQAALAVGGLRPRLGADAGLPAGAYRILQALGEVGARAGTLVLPWTPRLRADAHRRRLSKAIVMNGVTNVPMAPMTVAITVMGVAAPGRSQAIMATPPHSAMKTTAPSTARTATTHGAVEGGAGTAGGAGAETGGCGTVVDINSPSGQDDGRAAGAARPWTL